MTKSNECLFFLFLIFLGGWGRGGRNGREGGKKSQEVVGKRVIFFPIPLSFRRPDSKDGGDIELFFFFFPPPPLFLIYFIPCFPPSPPPPSLPLSIGSARSPRTENLEQVAVWIKLTSFFFARRISPLSLTSVKFVMVTSQHLASHIFLGKKEERSKKKSFSFLLVSHNPIRWLQHPFTFFSPSVFFFFLVLHTILLFLLPPLSPPSSLSSPPLHQT